MCFHDVQMNAILKYLKFLDTNGVRTHDWAIDGILGSDFSDLESALNLLLSTFNHFSKMKTLK